MNVLVPLCLFLLAPAPAPAPKLPFTGAANFLPAERFPEWGARVTAVLVTEPEEMLFRDRRCGPPGQLVLSLAGMSYRWVYVTDEKAPRIGALRLKTYEDEERVFPRLSMGGRDWLMGLKLPAEPMLIEATINDGDGAGTSPGCVVSEVKRIDGTDAFPPKLPELLRDARHRHGVHVSEMTRELDRLLIQKAKERLKEKAVTGPRERVTIEYITWLPDSKRVQVRIMTRLSDGAYQYWRRLPVETGRTLPLGLPAGSLVNDMYSEYGPRGGEQVGAELGTWYEFDAAGKLVVEHHLAPSGFHRTIPVIQRLAR